MPAGVMPRNKDRGCRLKCSFRQLIAGDRSEWFELHTDALLSIRHLPVAGGVKKGYGTKSALPAKNDTRDYRISGIF
jgi:hypothetical protein